MVDGGGGGRRRTRLHRLGSHQGWEEDEEPPPEHAVASNDYGEDLRSAVLRRVFQQPTLFVQLLFHSLLSSSDLLLTPSLYFETIH